MQTLTLSSESVVLVSKVHALRPSPKPLKFFHICIHSKFSHLCPNLILSRFAKSRRLKMLDKRSRQFLLREDDSSHSSGFEFWNNNRCDFIKSTFVEDDSCSPRLPMLSNTLREKISDPSVSEKPFCSYIKFMLICGNFMLQSTQHAVAGTEFPVSVPFLGDLGDISTGFASAFLLIFFSELGDKTFFIAALLAARNSGAVVFLGTFGALAMMTIISVLLGRTFHYVDGILPFRFGDADLPIDDIAAVCLLVYFGISTLLEATSGDSLKTETEQKEAELAVSELSGSSAGILAAANTVISTFLLVFVAEWGDKSFFSTIALAAASSPLGVIGGALAGHGFATLLAVLGGSLLGTFLSEKHFAWYTCGKSYQVIAYIGGTLFLIFAAVTLIEIVT